MHSRNLLFLFVGLSGATAPAETYLWAGNDLTATSSYFSPSNWSTGVVPGYGTSTVIRFAEEYKANGVWNSVSQHDVRFGGFSVGGQSRPTFAGQIGQLAVADGSWNFLLEGRNGYQNANISVPNGGYRFYVGSAQGSDFEKSSGHAKVTLSGPGKLTTSDIILGTGANPNSTISGELVVSKNAFVESDVVIVGDSGQGTLRVDGGLLACSARFHLSNYNQTYYPGQTPVDLRPMTFEVTNGGEVFATSMYLAPKGNGVVNVTNGGKLSATSISASEGSYASPDASTIMTVSGAGSAITLEQAEFADFDIGGKSLITVKDGGAVTGARWFTVGARTGSDAKFELRSGGTVSCKLFRIGGGDGKGAGIITGVGSNLETGWMRIGGVNAASIASLDVTDQASVSINYGKFDATFPDSYLYVSLGDVLRVNTGATFIVGEAMARMNTVSVGKHGILQGQGLIEADVVIEEGGLLAPGESPGLLSVGGNVTLLGGATLAMEVNGAARGTGYDALDVGGTVILGGKLKVAVLPTFTSVSRLELISATSIIGGFSSIELPTGWRVDTEAGRLYLQSVPEPASMVAMSVGIAAIIRRRHR